MMAISGAVAVVSVMVVVCNISCGVCVYRVGQKLRPGTHSIKGSNTMPCLHVLVAASASSNWRPICVTRVGIVIVVAAAASALTVLLHIGSDRTAAIRPRVRDPPQGHTSPTAATRFTTSWDVRGRCADGRQRQCRRSRPHPRKRRGANGDRGAAGPRRTHWGAAQAREADGHRGGRAPRRRRGDQRGRLRHLDRCQSCPGTPSPFTLVLPGSSGATPRSTAQYSSRHVPRGPGIRKATLSLDVHEQCGVHLGPRVCFSVCVGDQIQVYPPGVHARWN